MMKKLTYLQERFKNNILKGMDANNAFIKAGYKVRGAVAGAAASKLLKNAKVKAAIKEAHKMAKPKTKSKPSKKKHPGGRPTKYKLEYAEQGYKLALEGFTDKKIADFFNVNPDTIYEWQKVHPEFSESLKKGKDEFDSDVIEKSLAKRAAGYEYKEVTKAPSKKVDPKTGKAKLVTIKEVTKSVAPDPTSMIFWLKNRRPERWRDKQTIDIGVSLEDVLAGLPKEFADQVRAALGNFVSPK
ncbi:MAG: helix-turn-helix domain-containing protein [Candidatus Omnitrophota bacterium]|nr:MAG: helix-turn-helix domain-containing protein [Candidatus Omnitrophota bacterium]